MNPVLVVLVVLIIIILWFLLSFTFKPLGKIVHGIWKETVDTINETDEENKEEKGEE